MNIKEIAKLAGVSASTVSKIINKKDDSISDKTRDKVLKIVKEYNYQPYSSMNVTQKSKWVIGLLLRSNDSFALLANSFINTLQSLGYATIVCISNNSSEQELKHITQLCHNHVDGIIWEPIKEPNSLTHKLLSEKEIPFLTIGKFSETNQFPYSLYSYNMTQTLIHYEHRNIACLVNHNEYSPDFIEGYRKCLFDFGLTLNDTMIFNELNEKLLHKLTSQQISAIIVSDYLTALDFYQLANSLHYNLPNDFSLISFKNNDVQFPKLPEISAYCFSYDQFIQSITTTIINSIEKKSAESQETFIEYNINHLATLDFPYNLTIPKIIVVGSINTDIYLKIDKFPHLGQTINANSSSQYSGGKGINQSIGVAKLGHFVSLIGNIGSDTDADIIYQELLDHRVDTTAVKRCKDTHTGKAYIFVEDTGQSMISILSGANGLFSPKDIKKNEFLFKNSAYCLIQSEIPEVTVIEACNLAKKHHVKTIFKPSACNKFNPTLADLVDIIVPNEDELNNLVPQFDTIDEKAEFLYQQGIQTIIVTLGEKGSYLYTANAKKYFPAQVFTSIDSTGASDAFISALSSYLLYGYSLDQAIQIATYAAGFCISREGVVPSLIDRTSLESYIHQKEPDLLRI